MLGATTLPTAFRERCQRVAVSETGGATSKFSIIRTGDHDTLAVQPLPFIGRFEKLISTFGLSKRTRIVVHDQKGIPSFLRGWCLRAFSATATPRSSVAACPGGCAKAALPESGPVIPTQSHVTLRAERPRGLSSMIDAGSGRVVFDARTAARSRPDTPKETD